MDGAFLPPWLQPANPAEHLAQGYRIGIALGAQQAEQAFREQQRMRQQQEDAERRAQWEAEFGLRAKQAADKAAAIQDYQNAIAGGMDPVQAITRFGPRMQEPGAAMAAALRASDTQPQAAPSWVPPDTATGAPGYFRQNNKITPFHPPAAAKPPASIQLVDEAMKANQLALDAEKAGAPNAKELRDRANLLLEQTKKPNLALGWDDQGRLQTLSFGTGATPTVATASRAQQKLQKYENAVEIINRVQKGLEAGHVGVAGLAGEYLWDRGLVQLANLMGDREATADIGRVNSRSGLIMVRESLMREISDDPRFSIPDREEISKALPSSGAFESLSDAQQKLATVRDIIAKRSEVYAHSINARPPLWSLTPEKIRQMLKNKEIDQQTALNALVRFF